MLQITAYIIFTEMFFKWLNEIRHGVVLEQKEIIAAETV